MYMFYIHYVHVLDRDLKKKKNIHKLGFKIRHIVSLSSIFIFKIDKINLQFSFLKLENTTKYFAEGFPEGPAFRLKPQISRFLFLALSRASRYSAAHGVASPPWPPRPRPGCPGPDILIWAPAHGSGGARSRVDAGRALPGLCVMHLPHEPLQAKQWRPPLSVP